MTPRVRHAVQAFAGTLKAEKAMRRAERELNAAVVGLSEDELAAYVAATDKMQAKHDEAMEKTGSRP